MHYLHVQIFMFVMHALTLFSAQSNKLPWIMEDEEEEEDDQDENVDGFWRVERV